jgi:hypothetical protein
VTAARPAWGWLVERTLGRFDHRDPFADVALDPQTTVPDPLPAPAPVEPADPQPAPAPLAPKQALFTLHGRHPHLPAADVHWRIDDAVAGEVYALAADEVGQRRIVAAYADVLAVPVTEHVDGAHVTVSATGVFEGCAVTVAAVLIHDDTMPLPAYREAASTLTTQAIPDEVIQGVIAA